MVLDFVKNSQFYSFNGRVEELICDLLKEFFFSERNSGVGVALQLAAKALRRVESPEAQDHMGFWILVSLLFHSVSQQNHEGHQVVCLQLLQTLMTRQTAAPSCRS